MKRLLFIIISVAILLEIALPQSVELKLSPDLINTTRLRTTIEGFEQPQDSYQNATQNIGYIGTYYWQSGSTHVWDSYRSLFKIDLSSIPDEAYVANATLKSWVRNYDDNETVNIRIAPSSTIDIMGTVSNPGDDILE